MKTRPAGVTALSIFFMVATVIALVALISLLFPNGFLEPMWRLNPRGRAGLAKIGSWAVILFFFVGSACAIAAVGLWRCARWGYVVGIIVLSINLLGDVINVVTGTERRAALGVPIVISILVYLMTKRVRSFFAR